MPYQLTPHSLLDEVIAKLNAKSDGHLSRLLEIPPPTLSRIRNGKQKPSAEVILCIHEKTGMPVAQIKSLIQPA
jgi:plasmid maintenance system antidote protein VapI